MDATSKLQGKSRRMVELKVQGITMYRLSKNLREFKGRLKHWNKIKFNNVEKRKQALKEELD